MIKHLQQSLKGCTFCSLSVMYPSALACIDIFAYTQISRGFQELYAWHGHFCCREYMTLASNAWHEGAAQCFLSSYKNQARASGCWQATPLSGQASTAQKFTP